MSSPKTPPSATGTSRIFAAGKTAKSGDRGAGVTHERIASDLAEFHASGGHIEVLGTTRLLTRIGADAATAVVVDDQRVAAAAPQRRGKT